MTRLRIWIGILILAVAGLSTWVVVEIIRHERLEERMIELLYDHDQKHHHQEAAP